MPMEGVAMSTPKPSASRSSATREWSSIEARVLAYCEAELPRRGVRFTGLHVMHSTRPDYDALVEIWQDRHAYTVGVRLPAA
jgi:hypothetical protein